MTRISGVGPVVGGRCTKSGSIDASPRTIGMHTGAIGTIGGGIVAIPGVDG
jgi:hypothetical protein